MSGPKKSNRRGSIVDLLQWVTGFVVALIISALVIIVAAAAYAVYLLYGITS